MKNLYYRSIQFSREGLLVHFNLTVGDCVRYRDQYWWLRSICKPKGEPPEGQSWPLSLCLVPLPELAPAEFAKDLKDRPDWDIQCDWLDEGGVPCSLSEDEVPPEPKQAISTSTVLHCRRQGDNLLVKLGDEVIYDGHYMDCPKADLFALIPEGDDEPLKPQEKSCES